jgi:hypothetical protein
MAGVDSLHAGAYARAEPTRTKQETGRLSSLMHWGPPPPPPPPPPLSPLPKPAIGPGGHRPTLFLESMLQSPVP